MAWFIFRMIESRLVAHIYMIYKTVSYVIIASEHNSCMFIDRHIIFIIFSAIYMIYPSTIHSYSI